jgi:hypothetical protein
MSSDDPSKRGILASWVKAEFSKPDDILTVYHGGNYNPETGIDPTKPMSWTNGLGSGIVNDLNFSSGAVSVQYALHRGRWMVEADIKIEDLQRDDFGMYVPPLSPVVSASGSGEGYHPRLKALPRIWDIRKHIDQIQSHSYNINPEDTPWQFTTNEDYVRKVGDLIKVCGSFFDSLPDSDEEIPASVAEGS